MKPRLCLATDSLDPSGVGEHMLSLAEALRSGYDVVVAAPPSLGGHSLLARAAVLGVGVKLLGEDEAETAAWLRRRGFGLLHVHAGIGWEGHGLSRAGRAAGIGRIVRTEHLPDLITDPGQRRGHAQGVALVDRVVCVSQASARSHIATGLDPARVVVIRNGVAARPAARPPQEIRRDLGVPDDGTVILTVARFTPQKDHAALIRAAAAVLLQIPGAIFVLVGAGPLADDVRGQAEALGLADSMRFLGRRDDVPDLLGAADLFVLPSRFEGLPLVVLEAMAAGLPIVSTAVGGTDEVVIDGHTGRLVAPGDHAALAAAIVDCLTGSAGRQEMAEAGRRRFAKAFTAARMAADTVQLYSSLGVAPAARHRTETMDGGNGARTRIGFIGAGGIAQRHLGVLEQFDDVEIVAFADPARERATAAAERFGARSYADLDAMLEAETLDALYICVPPFAHGAPERAAIARKLPFFVEKPLALDGETAEAIGRAVEAAGLVTGCGYHWRYLDTVDEAKAVLADNPARFVSGYWLDSTPPPQWWWKQSESGGQMVEQTTHLIDLARYLLGDVTQVFALAEHTARDDFPGLDVATVSTASLRFASGAIGNLASTCLLRWNHRVGLHLFGDGLAIELTDHDIMIDVGRGRPYRHAEGDPVWREDRDFIDAVRGGENRIRCPYAEALRSHRISMAILRSVADGRAVELAPAATPAHVSPEIEHV